MKIPVSVVIPAFRASETIGNAVKSIISQTVIPDEIIVVDDFSDDSQRTVNAIKLALSRAEASGIKTSLIEMKINLGPGSARNLGINAACNDIIALLDADDTWIPNKLDLQYEEMRRDSELTLICHEFCMTRSHRLHAHKLSSLSLPCLLFRNKVVTSSVMARRVSDFKFPEGRRFSEDYEVWLQMAARNHKLKILNQVLGIRYKHVFGIGGLSGKLFEMQRGEIETFRRINKNGEISSILFCLVSCFSYLKFLRRLVIVSFRNWNLNFKKKEQANNAL